MGVRLNRCLSGELRCGEFAIGESGRPVLSCPLCAYEFDLPAHCRVEHDGKVVPAVKCPSVGCPMFEYVELESVWD